MVKRRGSGNSLDEVLFSRDLTIPEQRENDLFTYEIDPGRVYSRVHISEDSSIMYDLVEPYMNEILHKIYISLREKIVRLISDRSGNGKKVADTAEQINEAVVSSSLEQKGKKLVYYYLNRDFLGLDIIDGLLKDPNIEDITCDGSHVPVFVYHTSYGFIPTNVKFRNDEELNSFIRKTVQRTGKNISISSPLADSILPDGSRIQASLGRYVTTNGPSFTIRKFKEVPLSPIDLIVNGTASPDIFAYLWILTEYGANIMITGGTATGKTTFLNSILLFAPPEKKIVSIEDTREINLYHENWLSTVTRPGFGQSSEGRNSGEIDMFDLLVSSMRHRPDYVVIGEVRGRETFTVFQAMSVGRYSYCTFHADGVDTLIHRLESKPINIPRNLISSLDTVVVLSMAERDGRQQRITSTISEITGLDQGSGEIITNRLYDWEPSSNVYESSLFSYVLERIAERTGQSLSDLENEHRLRTMLLRSMIENGITRFDDVASIVRKYHRDRDSVLDNYSIH